MVYTLCAFIIANLHLICLEIKLTICYTVQYTQRKKISSFKENNPILRKEIKLVQSIISLYRIFHVAGRVAESQRDSDSSSASLEVFIFSILKSMHVVKASFYINHQLKWNKVHINYIVRTKLILIKTCILITVYSAWV